MRLNTDRDGVVAALPPHRRHHEHLGLCPEGGVERLLRSGATSIGGRIPVCASGGLASFGEAIRAQVIAQACELSWQLRGRATGRQVENAEVSA